MSETITAKTTEIDDGKEDGYISINGKLILTIHEDGYKSLGLTYEQIKVLAQFFVHYITGESKK